MWREGDRGSSSVPAVGLFHLLRQAVVVVSVVVLPQALPETVGPHLPLQAVAGVAPSHLAQDSPQTAWLRCNWLPVVGCPVTLF